MPKDKRKAKVLVLDIETSPMLAYVWGIKDQFIRSNQIYKDWYILAWCAKWLDQKKVYYYDTRNQKDDSKILKPLWELLNEADIVLTQNGKKFDSKKINARFMLNKYTPPSPYKHLDTYQIVKNVAGFTSNSLSYLSEKFCNQYKKLAHVKYSGMSLWLECLKDNKKAWKEMKKYNIQDVFSTEELYCNIKAWTPEALPKVYNMTNAAYECGTCGYIGPMREGNKRKAKKHYYRQHSCPKCGSWQKGEKV